MVNQTQIDDELQAMQDLRNRIIEEFKISRSHLVDLKHQAKGLADLGNSDSGHHLGAMFAFRHAIEGLDILQNGIMNLFDGRGF